MTPDQISKLPPELRPAAELWNEGYRNDPLSALNAALTYCLQMQEERDAREKDVAQAARLMPSEEEPEENAPWMVPAEPEPMGPFNLIEAITAMMEMLDREMRKDEKTIDALNVKLVTAEATIATLTRDLEKAQQMIAILWQNGKFGMSVGNALSEDGVLKKAIAADKERKTGAALSHTPEGKI